VCKRANSIISEHVLWKSSVRHIRQESLLFEPSFLPLCSMDLDDLKRAALRPHKLSRTFEAKAFTTLHCHPKLVLKCDVNDERRCDFIRVQIVPGGHYVVGLTDMYICLWDIGSPDSENGEPSLLDTVHASPSSGPYQTMTVPTRHSNNSFRFATHSDDNNKLNQR
jgi:hypothetical protein